ncbi:hypothetical protein G6F68_009506 [Rhizopus microsporus]|nr:hypothetical protein G6F68_009506 [Rhizopus microsporus]
MEIFEQLQYVLQEATSQAEATAIIDKCREQSRRLAVFGLATAKAQEKEARDYSDKALNIPISIRHLESAEEDPKTKNAYSNEFLNKFHQANFEQKLVQQASGSRGGDRSSGFVSRGNVRGGRGFRYGRGNGARGSFFGQGTPQRWGTNSTATAHTKTIHITIPTTTPPTTNNFHGKLQHSDRWNSIGWTITTISSSMAVYDKTSMAFTSGTRWLSNTTYKETNTMEITSNKIEPDRAISRGQSCGKVSSSGYNINISNTKQRLLIQLFHNSRNHKTSANIRFPNK